MGMLGLRSNQPAVCSSQSLLHPAYFAVLSESAFTDTLPTVESEFSDRLLRFQATRLPNLILKLG